MVNYSFFICSLALFACKAPAQLYETSAIASPADSAAPRILCVVAHPDDEISFAGTLYKTSSMLGGRCDVVVITNGEGGYKYATLAESIYGVELTEESVGRAALPAIRKAELLKGCAILGVANVYFLGQRDHRYTQDPMEVLGVDAGVWDLKGIRAGLRQIMARGNYDFVLTLAPTESTHGHHQAATILALEVTRDMQAQKRPVLLCSWSGSDLRETQGTHVLEGFPITSAHFESDLLFNRAQKFGYRDRLDYSIIANWAIAEHKSQGSMQLLMNSKQEERYLLFDVGPPGAYAKARALFKALASGQFTSKVY